MGRSYNEIKESTIEWCNKLKKEGIYSEKDFKDCENSFRDLSLGEIPEDMKEGKDRIENSYSLYNRTSDHLKDKLSENNSQVVIHTSNGLRVSANKDNTVYLANPDTIVKEEESYWRLIPKGDKQFLIISIYGNYLSVDENKRVSADRSDISPQTTWTIARSNGHISVESFHHLGYKLAFVNKDIILVGGISDTQKWKLKPIYSADESLIKLFDDTELLNIKNIMNRNIKKSLREKYKTIIEYLFLIELIKEIKDTLKILLNNANDRINKINNDYEALKKNYITIKNICIKYNTVTTNDCKMVRVRNNVPFFYFFFFGSNSRLLYRMEKQCRKDRICVGKKTLTKNQKKKLKQYFDNINDFEKKVAFTSDEILEYRNSLRENVSDHLQKIENQKNQLELYYEKQHNIFLRNDKSIKNLLNRLMKDILDSDSTINTNNLKLKSLSDEHRDILIKNHQVDIFYNEMKRKSDLTNVNKNIINGKNNSLNTEYYVYLVILIITIIICGLIIRSFLF